MSQIDDFLNGTSAPQAPAGQPSQIDAFLNPTPKRRTPAAIVNDLVIEGVNAAVGGVSAAANFVRPGNAFSGYIDRNIQAGEASQSDAVKAEKQRFQQDVANADGVLGELGAVGRYVVDNPVLAAAQAVGSFAGPGAAVKGGRTLASIAGLNAARGGLAGGAAAGAAMAGGDAAGTAYELSTKGGATDEQAVAAGRQASIIPAVIGGVGGVVGAERLVAGAKGFTGNAVSRAVKTAAVEGAQEGIEEGVTQYEGQRAAMPYDKTIDPMKGVAAAAGMGAALGAATGGGVSLLTGGHAAERAPAERPQIDPNRLNPEDVATYSQYIESGLKPEKQQQYRQMLAMAQDAAAPEQARAAAARDLHAAFAPEALIQAEGAGNAAPSQASAPSVAPAIDPNAGPLSKAASLAGDLGLAPQPAVPTAQEQRATLESAISRLPDAQQREARMNLSDLDNQSLPAGVRAMRDARLQELVSSAPAVPVELAPQDMERGRVVQNFDARAPDLPSVADYAPMIETAIAPEYRAEYQRLLDTARDQARPIAERDAAAEMLHATFSPDQLQRARTARPTPDTRLELQDTNPARYDNAIDFTPPAAPSTTVNPHQARIAELALAADLQPGEPMALNRAHALRRAAAEAGIPVSVVPHPSGRGYDVAPTARLDPAAQNATPQQEAAALLPFDQSPSGRMLAGQDGGVRAETRPEAVARTNAAKAERQQVEAERQRRTELGMSNITPVVPLAEAGNPASPRVAFDNAPTGRMVAGADGVRREGRAEVVNRANQPAPAPQTVTSANGAPFPTQQAAQQELQRQQLASTHEVAPAGGDESLGFVLQKKGSAPVPQQMWGNPTFEGPAPRAPNWRTNAMQANQVARGLGIETKGKRLAQVVAEIDSADRASMPGSFPARTSAPGPSTMSSSGAATSAPTTTVFAPELVAADADGASEGSPSPTVQGGGLQQDRAPRPGPRQESDQNQPSAPENSASAAIESGANSTATGPRQPRAAAPRPTTKIEDFGETLHGARKMLYAEAYADGMAKAKELDIKAHPLSKTWPEPDYQKLLEGGAPLEAVSLVRALREAVPTKPQSSWKLKGWSTQVETLRGFAEDVLSGQQEPSAVRVKLNRDSMPRGVADKVALYEAMGHERSLKGIDVSVGRYSMYDRVEYNPPRTIWSVSREAKGSSFANWPRELAKGDTREEAIAAFKRRAAELLAEERAPNKGATFEIYGKRAGGAREFFIGKKIGRNVAELKTGFADIKAARQYLADNQTELESLLDKYKAVPPVRNDQNAPRIGEDYRKGADVTPEQFQEAFGFRGVQFGNYVEGGRRQLDLNRAYDALMDLAGVLTLPPRALSLGGRLGLAFGARGTGGTDAAAAHYERGNIVINLTKREGAGSLAHEWWHGLDNYFSRERGAGDTYMTLDSQSGSGVREEMRAAFREVNAAINRTRMQERSRKLDDRKTKDYWTTKPEMSARAFESYVISKLQDQNAGNDYLANVVGASAFALEGGYPYPTAGELPVIRGAFDGFFETVETRQGEGGATVLYNTSDSKPPVRGLSLEEAQQAVQQALAGLANPPPIDVVGRSEEAWVGAPEGVMGAAVPEEGRIVLVASAHGSADAVVETLFHEMFHLGVRKVLPTPDYVQSMLDLAKRDSRVQKYATEWKAKAPDAPHQLRVMRERGYTGSELTARYEALAIEEGLAVVAEELRAQKQAGTRLGLRVRTLANWLASVADRMGMASLAERIRKMTYNEAERFVLKAIEHAGRAPLSQDRPDGTRFRAAAQTDTPAFQNWFGDSKAVDDAGDPLRVFHGTGGDFSVFSRDRAGAATGAANTGMGFFFTDNSEVAGNYARMSRDAQSIMPVYLSLQNPLRLDAKNMMEADKLLMSGLKPANDGAILRVGMRDGGTQTVFMVRQPGQIKSVTGNQGTFDASNPDIRFRSRDETPAAARMGEALKSVTVANLKQQAGFKATDYRGLGLQLLGRRQLVDVYGDMLPEMRRYSDLMARMDADKNEAGSGADQLAQDWAALDEKPKYGIGPAKYPGMERALAELMHDSTLAQIDPSKNFVEGDNKTDWTKLQARYNALSPAAKDVYARARDTYRQHMRDVRSAIKERIERTEISSERKAAMLKRMDDEFFGHIKGVYFPLARFGQYVVVVKDAEGKVANVSRAETMAEADASRAQLQRAFPTSKGYTVGKVLKAKDFVAERDSVGRGFMEQLYGVLDKQGMDTKQRAELEDALGQLYLSSLPDLSWAKHGIHRKGTAGFSQDARRAFAQNVFHGASYLAKLRYGDRLQDELSAMQRRVDEQAGQEGFDQPKAQDVVSEMMKRHEAAMNPKTNGLSTMLTSLGFIFHLGLSPASAMVNLTQTALVAYPVMGAKWGFKKASAALLKASGEAARGKNDITGSLSAEEKAAFDEAVRSGVIDVTMAHDLAGIAQGEDQNVSYKLRPVMRAASFLFHHAEKFNRQITFVAAYRLAREAGAGDKAAYEQAVQATYDGHFDYSSNNRPRAMQGNVARVVLLFKQYGQNMVYTLVRNAQQSLKGASPQDRAQARKALGGLLVMHGLAAGALGLPMVTTLLAAASMLGGDDDEPWDAQVALQNMLADTFGQKPAEVMAHGLSRLTPWDISGRVGLDKLIFPDVQEGLEGQRLAEAAGTAAMGPVFAIFANGLKGAQSMTQGRYQRGLEEMAPSVLRGPLKSMRYYTEGVRDKSGIVVQDEVGVAELLGQASGFSPSSVRNSFEGKSAIVQQDRALMARRSALVEQFAMAAMAGDEEGKASAREDIARFNEKNPNRRIQPMQLAQSVNMRQKRIREAQEGVYLPGKRRDALEAGRFAVPD